MILFDADVAIEILRRRPSAVEWFGSLPRYEVLAVLGYVAMELAAGCQSIAQLSDLQRWLSWFRIRWLPQNQAHQAMQDCFRVTLRNAIGVLDFLVARAAVLRGVPIQTFNVKHFRAVRGLRISVSYRR